jgi:hypothetical protein
MTLQKKIEPLTCLKTCPVRPRFQPTSKEMGFLARKVCKCVPLLAVPDVDAFLLGLEQSFDVPLFLRYSKKALLYIEK